MHNNVNDKLAMVLDSFHESLVKGSTKPVNDRWNFLEDMMCYLKYIRHTAKHRSIFISGAESKESAYQISNALLQANLEN
jgi:hypothetical protein